MTDGWIAVDWGTTRLRAWRMEGDRPVESRDGDRGMAVLEPDTFEPALLELVDDWLAPRGTTEVVACGMVGARQGWTEAPYAPVPCPPAGSPGVAAPVADPRLSVRILPGLSQTAPHPDVMRGEEVQIAGLLAARPDFDGVACLPGTHTKWAHLSAGEVVSFRTTMTGELFALLTGHGVLRHSTAGEGWDATAFDEAVSDALSRPERAFARLFELRAADLLEGQAPATARARLSGLLIGAELAATRAWWLGREVALIGAPRLSQAYEAALAAQGVPASRLDGAEAVLAGLAAARHIGRTAP